MDYALDNARFQWEEGERRVSGAPEPARADLEQAVEAVLAELRRRLGGSFTVGELADLYAEGTDWAQQVAERRRAGGDSAWVVDAAFNRYAPQASDYAGGVARETHQRP